MPTKFSHERFARMSGAMNPENYPHPEAVIVTITSTLRCRFCAEEFSSTEQYSTCECHGYEDVFCPSCTLYALEFCDGACPLDGWSTLSITPRYQG